MKSVYIYIGRNKIFIRILIETNDYKETIIKDFKKYEKYEFNILSCLDYIVENLKDHIIILSIGLKHLTYKLQYKSIEFYSEQYSDIDKLKLEYNKLFRKDKLDKFLTD